MAKRKRKKQRSVTSNNSASTSTNMEPSNNSYDDIFPALPAGMFTLKSSNGPLTLANVMNNNSQPKMRVASSEVTKVFCVPVADRRQDVSSEKFGDSEDSYRICTQISKETESSIEISTSKDKSLTFMITGKEKNVLQARKKVLDYFQKPANITITIPKEHHRMILGKNGDRLKELEKNTGTKISIPSVSDISDKITIVGSREGLEKAVHEIKVISDEQSKKAFQRVTVPKLYHPFIVGANNALVNELAAETKTRINVPPHMVDSDTITIVGEKEGVERAAKRILDHLHELEETISFICVEIPKWQHKYIIGPRRSMITEILQETGVNVEVPPAESTSNTITLRGPHTHIGEALNSVFNITKMMISVEIDAPLWTRRFIIGKKGTNIRKIQEQYEKCHIDFVDDQIRLEGPKNVVAEAKEALEELVKYYVDEFVITEIIVDDPKYFKYIIGKNGAKIQQLKASYDVSIIIKEAETIQSIRIEGPKSSVAIAKEELEDQINKLRNEKECEIVINPAYHRSIIGNKGDNVKELQEKFQVNITFPNQGEKSDKVKIRGQKEDVDKCYKHLMSVVKEMEINNYTITVPIYKQFHKFIIGKGGANIRKIKEKTGTKIGMPAEGDSSDAITITGKRKNVEEARDEIQKIQNEMSNVITEEVPMPQEDSKVLQLYRKKILDSISESCGGVSIFIRPDKYVIRGPCDDVAAAKEKVLNLATQPSCTEEIRTNPNHHKFLIGKNGLNIKRIREMSNAQIFFPYENDEDKELIVIAGSKDSVKKAKAELLAMINQVRNVVEEVINVDPKYHKHFLTSRGEIVRRIMDETGGVTISFPKISAQTSSEVVLKGGKKEVEMAKEKIREVVKDLEKKIELDINIDPKYHRYFTARKLENLFKIIDDCGGAGNIAIIFPKNDIRDPRVIIKGYSENVLHAKKLLTDIVADLECRVQDEVEVDVRHHKHFLSRKGKVVQELIRDCGGANDLGIFFAKHEMNDPVVVLKGYKESVELAKAKILSIVRELDEQVTIEVSIPQKDHRTIIRSRTSPTLDDIRRIYNVKIVFPDFRNTPTDMWNGHSETNDHGGNTDNEQAKLCDIVRITGRAEKCEAAKEELLSMAPITVVLDIPHDYHGSIIGQHGNVIREIIRDYDVQVGLPRMEEKSNTIKIYGRPSAVKECKEAILKKKQEIDEEREDRELKAYEEKLTINAEFWPQIIGRGGEAINKLRIKHGVNISFPKKDSAEDFITITGYKDKVVAAKNEIMESVNRLESRYKETVNIDRRVHPRMIGAKGHAVKKVMDDYNVEIRFPRDFDPDPSLVVIYGDDEDHVIECKEHLQMLEEQYLDSIRDKVELPADGAAAGANGKKGAAKPANRSGAGFVVTGAPWHQKAPDTNSTSDFPSMLGNNQKRDSEATKWGPHR